jgi:hypothetical protein
MLFRAVTAKSLSGHFEFSGAVTERQEAQDPKQDTNGFGADVFDGSNIYSLRVVPEPVAKVDLAESAQILRNKDERTYSLDIKL